MGGYDEQLGGLSTGHALLAACAVCYLAWWWVFFRPRADSPMGLERSVGITLILAAVALGLAAVIRIGGSLASLPSMIPGILLWPLAIVAYVALLLLTTRVFDRQPTTELVLIVAWCALEVAVAGALAACGLGGRAVAATAVAVAGFVASMVCYVLYYRLSGMAAFLDGCVPLVSVAVTSVVLAVLI